MPPADSSETHRNVGVRDRTVRFVVWVALLGGCGLALVRVVLTLPLHVPLNYNEGWNAYHTADVVAGQPLYAAGRPYFFNNYPPLSFLAVAAATRIVPDAIVAGRWLALISFGVWTIVLIEAAVAFGCRRAHACFGALLFAATILVFTDYVGIDDPQMMGHAIASVGLVALLRAASGRAALVVAAVMFVLAVFVKQNLVVLPIACVLWLACLDRWRAWFLAAAIVAAGAATVGISVAAFGTPVIASMMLPRVFLPLKGAWMAVQWLLRAVVLIFFEVLLFRKHSRDSAVIFVTIYVGVAAVIGAVLGAGAGVNWNVFFDADWALCLGAAVALERAGGRPALGALRSSTGIMAGCAIVPVIAALAAFKPDHATKDYWLNPRAAETADAAEQIAFLSAEGGPAICEELALCFWSGKPVEVDVFNAGQQILLGRVDQQPLIAAIDRGRFAAIQMNMPSRDISPAIADSILRRYFIDHAAFNRVFLVPRPR
jgi:hypothetical protein